jgi:hypothetical protein
MILIYPDDASSCSMQAPAARYPAMPRNSQSRQGRFGEAIQHINVAAARCPLQTGKRLQGCHQLASPAQH